MVYPATGTRNINGGFKDEPLFNRFPPQKWHREPNDRNATGERKRLPTQLTRTQTKQPAAADIEDEKTTEGEES